MSLTVQTNILMMNAQSNFKVHTQNKTKTMEKLSSGYKINRAADDAAGLTISEKMRLQIRGLNQGTRNAEDGVSWVQIGDSSLNEVHDMLHRMKELTIKSLNETNTAADRAAMQAEFDALQSEIDRITGTTEFNTKPIFDDHEPTYFEFEGNVVWAQSQPHVINTTTNNLIIEYKKDAASAPETITITIPSGIYTTQELTDEVDSALADAGIEDIVLEYTNKGTFNLSYEGGEKIESVTGGLSYLLYDMYTGGSIGALIGTTVFPSEDSELEISSHNNQMSFTIEDFDGNSTTKSITLANGFYTRSELIDILNQELAGTTVTAMEYGTGIKLSSDSSIITGFKGNMFKIDEGDDIYTSVFYDNVKYGSISTTSGYFLGAGVIPTASWDEEHKTFDIKSGNNTLTFKANGSTTPVSIQIPEYEYSVNEMIDKLNELFADNDLDLKASLRVDGSYQGIRIDSTVKGATSMVGLDATSSAYATLFTKRVYNSKTENPLFTRDKNDNVNASFTGSQAHSHSNLPLTITQGSNDQFALNISTATGSNTYTITVPAVQYTDAVSLAAAINEQLNGSSAASGYKDMLKAEATTAGTIMLTANAGTGIVNLTASATGTNTGYDDIFLGERVDTYTETATGTGTSTTPPSVTLNTVIANPSEVTSSNNSLTITINGVDATVTLPTGSNVTHDDIVTAIETQLPGGTATSANTFSKLSATGTTVSNNFTKTSAGTTTTLTRSYSATGDSKVLQGQAGSYEYNNAATITTDTIVPTTMEITDSNNTLLLNINGSSNEIKLTPNKTYTRAELLHELQKQIDNTFSAYAGGATVSLDASNKLVITARLNNPTGTEIAGKSTSLSLNTSSSSFLKELHTTRTAANITTNTLKDSIRIDTPNNTFVFTYTEAGTSQTVTLNLTPGTYGKKSLAAEIQYQLDQQGIDVKAEINNGALMLTTKNTGTGNALSYSTYTGGSSVESLFGEMQTHTPASATTDRDIQDSITISNATKSFSITANNRTYTFDLQTGTYNRDDFVQMLNDKLTANNVPISVTLTGNRMTYTTTTAGSSSSFVMEYSSGGTSMLPIYGKTTGSYPGIDAEFVGGKLKLTGTLNGGSIKVSSDSGSIFQTPKTIATTLNPSITNGYTSVIKSSVDGAALNGSVTIDEWNEDLSFTFVDNGTEKTVSFELTPKEYTYSELESVLQNEINTDLGDSNLVKVSVSDAGVRFEAINPGRATYFKSDFAGGFYHKVLTKTAQITSNRTPDIKNGSGPKDTAYTIGRKNVKDAPVTIKAGKNDTLTLDLTYSGTVHTITMTLDEGTYEGNSLKKMIQEKLNEQLTAMGLSENLVEVGIGGINTGVVGANDSKALNFKLSSSVLLPADGQYIIDGVRGNAAFSVFYQTDGELKESYTQGSKDISKGVTIQTGKEDLSFEVDGVSYTISLTVGTYTQDEILTEINDKLTASGAPVIAEIDDNNLRLTHQKLGPHTISTVTGGAKEDLFFQTNGRVEEEENILIQFSSVTDDDMEIDRPILNTVFLGINSSVITKTKYAQKALDRLDAALDIASDVRSMFGAYQNRLEHSINNNENKSENTQAAESRLRDADLSKEMVQFSVHNIVAQASQAIMAQSGSNSEHIIRLLQS